MIFNPSEIVSLTTVKQGDTSRLLYDDLHIGGTPINLSGSTVTLVWYNPRTETTSRKSATINVAASGSVSYQLTSSDLETAGSYILEWEVEFADGTQVSIPTEGYLKLNIEEDLD